MNKLIKLTVITALVASSVATAFAAGMKPGSSVLFLDDSNREATIEVTNTDTALALLHSKIETIAEDRNNKLIVTPQLARVDAGKKQQIRVVLKEGVVIKEQTMQRINFVSVPTDDGKKNRARVLVGQNIPIIISPASLPVNTTPWTGLTVKKSGSSLLIENPSAYIVRLTTQVDLLPGTQKTVLPKTYILPKQKITIALPAAAKNPTSIRLHPVTRFGVLTSPYDMPL